MIILFANQKGGCGKTTNCIQFSNYLSKKEKVVVLDLDFQRSIKDRRDSESSVFEELPPYEVIDIAIDKVAEFLKNTEVDGNLLIDLPGRIDDVNLQAIFEKADVIICPFKYDKLTIDSTGFFLQLMKELKIKAKIFFVPNNINKSIRYENKNHIIDILSQHGFVTDEIPSRVAMERLSTYGINDEALSIVKPVYDFITKNI